MLGGTAGDGLLEGVEVHDDEVDLGDFVLCQLLVVAVHVAAGQNAAEHFGVQCFYAAAQNGGIAGETFHSHGFDTEFFDKLLGAAGAVDGHALCIEGFHDVLKAILVKDGDEG